MMLFNKERAKRGQSTVEYILLVTAVIAVVIIFTTNRNGGLQGRLANSYNAVGSDMESKAVVLGTSHGQDANAPQPSGQPDLAHSVDVPAIPVLPSTSSK